MKTLQIPEELHEEIQKLIDSISACRAGINHLSHELSVRQKTLWRLINEQIPETKGWSSRLREDTMEIVLLCREQKE